MQSLTDLMTPEVFELVHLKGYFKGSSNSLDHALDKVIHRETTICALGGLINHLTRLMVFLLLYLFNQKSTKTIYRYVVDDGQFVIILLQSEDVLLNGDIYPYQVYKGCLKMDGQTLVNLEIFSNNADGGQSGASMMIQELCIILLEIQCVILKSILLNFQVHYTSILTTVLPLLESVFSGIGSAIL